MILSHHHAAMRFWIFVTGLATTLTVALADDLGTRDDGAVTDCTGYKQGGTIRRQLRAVNPETPSRLGLGQTLSRNDRADRASKFRFRQCLLGTLDPQIGEHVAAALGQSDRSLWTHGLEPPFCSKCIWARRKRARIRSISFWGVAIPRLAFFWKAWRT